MTRPRLLDLPHGYQAQVDEADWPAISELTLYRGTNGYVYFSQWRDGRSWPQTLHGLLMRPPAGSHVDHINGDKLDNCRENLRVVTPQRNQVNRKRPNRNNQSGVRGVSYAPRLSETKPWRVQIMVDRKQLHVGLFVSKDEAIAARQAAELEHFGELCPVSKPRILDLFCGAGGAAKGYQRAGFYVVGVDIEPQPNYPFRFYRGDALEVLKRLAGGDDPGWPAGEFDAIHASPPCQAWSALRHLHDTRHPELVEPTRRLLAETGLPYVIENVPGAPLIDPLVLCGSSFGLDLRRHRLFETNFAVMGPPCAHGWQAPRFEVHDRRAKSASTVVSVAGHATPPLRKKSMVSVHGSSGGKGGVAEWRRAMDIDWMSGAELAQAIPPAYTEHIGYYLMAELCAQQEPATLRDA